MSHRYRVVAFPTARNPIVDTLEQGKRRHHVHGFGEVDVTELRRRMHALGELPGGAPSLTAYLVWCLGQALGEFPEIQAFRRGRKLYLFEDVDVSTIVERETADGLKMPVTKIVRGANRLDYAAVHAQIRDAQRVQMNGISLGDGKEARMARRFARLPRWVRALVWWKMRRNPVFAKSMIGTANVTAVGMFGAKGGWAMGPSIWPISLLVGGMLKRPAVVEDRVEIREFLALTMAIDHETVDGAPAARFATRLVELIETGEGLPPVPERAEG
ncbi:MAG: 2-oxo acid dehydrogenase subunit E2 [Nevskiales bacterium]|nr:2-oxo acid dehydrogenase subunit E2 [Nevskiales bacterium]